MKSGINSETMGEIMKYEQNYENLWKSWQNYENLS